MTVRTWERTTTNGDHAASESPLAGGPGNRPELRASAQLLERQVVLQLIGIIEAQLRGARQGAQRLLVPALQRLRLGGGVVRGESLTLGFETREGAIVRNGVARQLDRHAAHERRVLLGE